MKYQKKPVTVEVWKLNHKDSTDSAPKWVQKAWHEDGLYYVDNHTWHILTLEGEMIAEDGDYLIQGVHGEIYSCKPDIFEETYVKVDDTDRISHDDIGNDIHEFLHGGDK